MSKELENYNLLLSRARQMLREHRSSSRNTIINLDKHMGIDVGIDRIIKLIERHGVNVK